MATIAGKSIPKADLEIEKDTQRGEGAEKKKKDRGLE